ncbi:unnamed protein product [Symbiodinium sp. CCMP2592]|nr:unnamed protein product [Symbiodinium sp. CCMP2592]
MFCLLLRCWHYLTILIAMLGASKALIPTVSLANGAAMQRLALGLYNVPRDQVKVVIDAGLKAGLRHFDFASFYNNEAECGAALRQWLKEGHSRSELFITTKVWTTDLGDPSSALRSAEISIDELGLGAVDLVMVHWPMPGKHVAAYLALEELVRSGKAKALGISNYSPADYQQLMESASLAPLVNTFENNPLLYRKEWCDFFQDQGVVVQAYKPLQRGGPVLSCDAVRAIAERCGRSPAQVCLRWNLEKGNAIVFKSLTPSRIEENVDVFDFSLAADEVAALDALTTEEVRAEAQSHWEQRRSGTDAPWGPGLRPEKRTVQEA